MIHLLKDQFISTSKSTYVTMESNLAQNIQCTDDHNQFRNTRISTMQFVTCSTDRVKSAFNSVTMTKETTDAQTIAEPHDTSDRFSRPLLIHQTWHCAVPARKGGETELQEVEGEEGDEGDEARERETVIIHGSTYHRTLTPIMFELLTSLLQVKNQKTVISRRPMVAYWTALVDKWEARPKTFVQWSLRNNACPKLSYFDQG